MADVTDEQRSGPTSEAEDVILRLDDNL